MHKLRLKLDFFLKCCLQKERGLPLLYWRSIRCNWQLPYMFLTRYFRLMIGRPCLCSYSCIKHYMFVLILRNFDTSDRELLPLRIIILFRITGIQPYSCKYRLMHCDSHRILRIAYFHSPDHRGQRLTSLCMLLK